MLQNFSLSIKNSENLNANVFIEPPLIVEFKKNTSDLYSIKQELKKEIQDKFNIPVDICREKYIKPIFKQQILSEAKYA